MHTASDRVSDSYSGLTCTGVAHLRVGPRGQVLLSQVTRDLVGAELPEGFGLRDLGEHRLKDLTHPQRLAQLAIPGLAEEFPALRTLGPPRPVNLPVQPTRFVGRGRELALVHELLDDPRAVW